MQKISANFKGKRVLVVEDYIINQELTKEMIELMGCIVDVAGDGGSALEKYNNNEYDVILMDVQMPDKDGYEVTKEIRIIECNTNRKRTSIIAITANALAGDEKKCLDSGMDDYISKPMKGSKLEEKLKKYLG